MFPVNPGLARWLRRFAPFPGFLGLILFLGQHIGKFIKFLWMHEADVEIAPLRSLEKGVSLCWQASWSENTFYCRTKNCVFFCFSRQSKLSRSISLWDVHLKLQLCLPPIPKQNYAFVGVADGKFFYDGFCGGLQLKIRGLDFLF